MRYALTVDVEDWYQTKDFDFENWDGFEDRVERNVMRLLELFFHNNVHATFFILGYAAEKHPNLVREIAKYGHEIASHGMRHTLVTCQRRDEFKSDLLASKAVIEDAAGVEVNIYRASSWSISKDALWALEVLDECGFMCDSSIQPFVTPLSGMRKVPDKPFHPIVNGNSLKLIEFPSTVVKRMGVTIPFSGGFYLRFWPYSFIRAWLTAAGKQKDAFIYCHPWEIDTEQPRLKAPLHIKMVHYYNLRSTYKKLEKLLMDFKFCTMGDIVRGGGYSSYEL